MYGDEKDFEYTYEQTDIDETFCNLKMVRTCLMPKKYYGGGSETRFIEKIRKNWVEYNKQTFEIIPELKPTHHISIDVDVPPEKENELRKSFIVERIKLHPTIPYNVSGVEGGICFCTIGLKNQTGLLAELKKLDIPDNYICLWEENE